jgi:hypothetical protein
MRNAQHIIEKISILSKAQRGFLVAAVQAILCCRWRINFRSLAEVSAYGEKTYRRQYGRTIDFVPLHRAVADSVLASSSGLRVIGFDPTFLPKAGKHTPGISKFWNGSAQRAESGLEATLTAVIDVGHRIAFPLAIQQTLHPKLRQTIQQNTSAATDKTATDKTATDKTATDKTATDKTATDKTATDKTATDKTATNETPKESWLIAEYLHHLRQVKPLLHKSERHLVVDAYFAKKSFLDGIDTVDLFCITKLRKDANLKYFYHGQVRAKGRGRQKVYDGKVEWNNLRADAFERTVLEDGTVLLSAVLFHTGVKRRLTIVIVQQQHHKGMRQTILASTDLSLDALSIYRAYGARFQLEFVIRDAKGFTGLTDAQTRNLNALDTHLNMSMLALGLAKAEHYQRVGIESEKPFSMNAIKTRAFNEHFALRILSIYGLSAEMIKNHPEFQNISNYAIVQT